jgi:hypothetical protein
VTAPFEPVVSREDLGSEFLTYLWHAGESGVEEVFGKVPVRLQVLTHLKLKAPDGSGSDIVVKGDYASQAPEVFMALWRGALVAQAKVKLDINGAVVVGTMKAADLTLSGCKLPKVEEEPAPRVEPGEKPGGEAEVERQNVVDEAKVLFRTSLLDQAQDILDQWFARFLEERGSKRYEGWAESFREWVGKNVKALSAGKPR